MKRYALLLFVVFAALCGHAQDTVYVHSNLEKIKSDWQNKLARYYYLTNHPDAGTFENQIHFYDRKGNLYAEVNYSETGKKHGLATFYHDDGSKEREQNYVNGEERGAYKKWYRNGQINEEGITLSSVQTGKSTEYLLYQYWDSLGTQLLAGGNGHLAYLHKNGAVREKGLYGEGRKVGKWTGYHDDGSLYFEEEYLQGVLLQGSSYKNGRIFKYSVIEEESQPIGGMKAFYDQLAKNIKYPKKAVKAKKQGTVYVRFTINEIGIVEFAEAMEGRELGYGLDEEAIRVIYLIRWVPGKLRGIEVKQRKILPLKFSLNI